jgi:carbamate kinase
MELKDTLVTGATVLAVGTSSVVGGNAVVDKVNDGPTKRQDATIQRVMKELAPYIDQRIQQLVPTTTGPVVPTTKEPQLDYRQNVPKR